MASPGFTGFRYSKCLNWWAAITVLSPLYELHCDTVLISGERYRFEVYSTVATGIKHHVAPSSANKGPAKLYLHSELVPRGFGSAHFESGSHWKSQIELYTLTNILTKWVTDACVLSQDSHATEPYHFDLQSLRRSRVRRLTVKRGTHVRHAERPRPQPASSKKIRYLRAAASRVMTAYQRRFPQRCSRLVLLF